MLVMFCFIRSKCQSADVRVRGVMFGLMIQVRWVEIVTRGKGLEIHEEWWGFICRGLCDLPRKFILETRNATVDASLLCD